MATRASLVALIGLALLRCRPDASSPAEAPHALGLVAAPVAAAPADPAAAALPAPFDLATGLADLAPEGFAAGGLARPLDELSMEKKLEELDSFYDDEGQFVSIGRHAACQRFVATSESDFEACVYVLRDRRAAMAAFLGILPSVPIEGSPVRRSDAHSHAWEAPGLLAFTQDDAYVEVRSVDPAAPGEGPRKAFAAAFAARYGGVVAEAPPFSSQGLRPGRLKLVMRSAFGLHGFDGIYVADYEGDGAEATAFWSDRASPAEAEALARAWLQFLQSHGATPAALTLPGATVLQVLGFTEVACVRGANLGGVHQAESLELARQLAAAVCPPPGG